MSKDVFLAATNCEIFGPTPKDPMAMVGYNAAKHYYGPLIPMLESANQNIPDSPIRKIELAAHINNALFFSEHTPLRALPEQSVSELDRCANIFRERYTPLLAKLQPTTA